MGSSVSKSYISVAILALAALGCGGSGAEEPAQATSTPIPLARAWAAGDTIVRSDDGGRTWEVVLAAEGLTSVSFADRSSGWAVAPQTILATTDGGDSWVDQSSGVDFNVTRVYAVSAPSASRAVIVGGMVRPHPFAGGFGLVDVRLTTDAGATWRRPRIDFQADGRGGRGELRRLCLTDTGLGFACGRDFNTFNGVSPFCHLGAMDSDWQDIGDRIRGDAVACVGATTLWALGGRTDLSRSIDGGVTWVAQPTIPLEFTGNLDGIAFATELLGWVVGEDAAGFPAILHTTDGGGSWATQEVPGDARAMFTDVQFADADNGVAVGSTTDAAGAEVALAYTTSNGGEEWVLATFPPDTPELRSVAIVP